MAQLSASTNLPTDASEGASNDNLCKFLAENYPEQLVKWLFGVDCDLVLPAKAELSREPTRADAAILLESGAVLFHIEFQTNARSHAPLELRMLDYYVGFARLFPARQIRQALVVLHDNGRRVPEGYTSEFLQFRYTVVKLWEQDAAQLLAHEGLLSLATLCHAAPDGLTLLTQVAERIQSLPEASARLEQIALARALAGLRFDTELIYSILQGGNMLEESVVYQDIIRQGRQRGLQEGLALGTQQGLQQGLQQGRQEGLEREQELILRQLERRCGPLSNRTYKQILALSHLRLEDLGEALLDFQSKKDLTAWLKRHPGTVTLKP